MAFMAAAVPFIQAIGTVVSVISAFSQGRASSSASTYNAQVMAQNADIARSNASMQAAQIERETKIRLGAIRAAQGKSGGTGDSGSVLDVLGDVASQSELERQHALYQGELQARGYQNSAALDSAAASNAGTSGFLRAGSELLSGSVKAYGTYNSFASSSGAGKGLLSGDEGKLIRAG